jgi:hypothetical protein
MKPGWLIKPENFDRFRWLLIVSKETVVATMVYSKTECF